MVLLSFLALPPACASPPASSSRTYRITEEELMALEKSLTAASKENEEQKQASEKLKVQLEILQSQSKEREDGLRKLRESWNECERENRRELRRLKRERNASWLIVAGLVGYMAARR
jgi:septal ring factor EnvC (AmiA/AmiB activator)